MPAAAPRRRIVERSYISVTGAPPRVATLSTNLVERYSISDSDKSNKSSCKEEPQGYTGHMSVSLQAPSRLESWVSFLRAHSAITRQLNVDLLNVHGLTLNDYEVLLLLSRAENRWMRRVDLAQSVVLTA